MKQDGKGLFAGDVGRDDSCSGDCDLLELEEAGSSFEDGVGTDHAVHVFLIDNML